MCRNITALAISSQSRSVGIMGVAVRQDHQAGARGTARSMLARGTNDIGIRLLRKQPDISVTAIDRSKEMQEEGRIAPGGTGVRHRKRDHDVHELPFPDSSFDVVTLQAASRHLQLDKVLPEILRVLKPGGCFYHCDMLKPGSGNRPVVLSAIPATVGRMDRSGVRIDRGVQELLRIFQGCDQPLLLAGRAVPRYSGWSASRM